jgi:hypothetical protein
MVGSFCQIRCSLSRLGSFCQFWAASLRLASFCQISWSAPPLGFVLPNFVVLFRLASFCQISWSAPPLGFILPNCVVLLRLASFCQGICAAGRRMRVLAVVDDCMRECLALVPDTSISGIRLASELDRLLVAYGKPKTIGHAQCRTPLPSLLSAVCGTSCSMRPCSAHCRMRDR